MSLRTKLTRRESFYLFGVLVVWVSARCATNKMDIAIVISRFIIFIFKKKRDVTFYFQENPSPFIFSNKSFVCPLLCAHESSKTPTHIRQSNINRTARTQKDSSSIGVSCCECKYESHRVSFNYAREKFQVTIFSRILVLLSSNGGSMTDEF